MTRIRRLSRDMVNKIAAGEVVERPASVVKELVENSIDAESSRIEIALEDGGKRLVRVTDDGVGMSPEDLALAFESHTTSKISEPDDLFQISTLGFRGEALASIASVSHCRAVSRARGAAEGAVVEVEAGRIGEVRPCGAPEGTTVEVRDLFFNTPARLKFLRSTATELRHIVEMVTRLALPHYALEAVLTHEGRQVIRLPPCESLRERLVGIFGAQTCERLLPIRAESSVLTLTGFISPAGEGELSPLQYVFLNGRYIRDRAIQRAIAEAYRSRLLRGRFPVAFLNLQMEPSRVDVNVHPTKVEVRFRDPGAVFAQVISAIEKALSAAAPKSVSAPTVDPGDAREEKVRRAVADFLERKAGAQRTAEPPFAKPPPATSKTIYFPAPAATQAATEEKRPIAAEAAATRPTVPQAAVRNFAQIHDSYIVEEVEGGFLVIDQHALHERILYEELRQHVRGTSVPRQRLIVPEVVDLPPSDFLLAMEMRESLLKLGLEVEPFGERTVAVHSVPHMATGANPRELLLEVLREIGQATPSGSVGREELLLRAVACKAAIKAGQRLSRAQIEALLERRDRLGPAPVCPHGRPTTVRFDLKELAKQFNRK